MRAGAVNGPETLRLATPCGIELSAHLWNGSSKNTRKRGVLYIGEKPKNYNPARNATCQALARDGAVVLDFDPRGMSPRAEIWLDFVPLLEANLSYDAFLLGQPLLGARVADVHSGIALLAARDDVDANDIHLVGEGYGALLALFAACLDTRIASVTERRGLQSYASLVFNREYAWPVSFILPGVLRHFDLDDIRAAIAPRSSVLIEPLDHLRCFRPR